MESDSSLGWQGKGALEELMRERIRTTIEGIIEEELVAALGAARSQRSGLVRVGYRHGERTNADNQPWPHHHRNAAGADCG